MRIYVTSIFVEDQAEALAFYTTMLGFTKKTDIPVGEYRWLTVTAPDGPEAVELLLEPNQNPAAKIYQQALYEQGIAAASFATDAIEQEYERLRGDGVAFTMPPTAMGNVTVAMFDDTCGNLIQLVQMG